MIDGFNVIGILSFILMAMPSMILYTVSWFMKNRNLQIFFSILVVIIPAIIMFLVYPIDNKNIFLMPYFFLFVFVLFFASIKIIILKKLKIKLPLIPIITGIIITVPFIIILMNNIGSIINSSRS